MSALDHINSKVETSFQKCDKMSVSVVTTLGLTCEIYIVVGHISIACQLLAMGEPSQEVASYETDSHRGNTYYNIYSIW